MYNKNLCPYVYGYAPLILPTTGLPPSSPWITEQSTYRRIQNYNFSEVSTENIGPRRDGLQEPDDEDEQIENFTSNFRQFTRYYINYSLILLATPYIR